MIEFHRPAEPLNLNRMPGSDFGKRQWRHTKNLWLEAAYFGACAAFPGKGPEGRAMPPCEVFISIPVVGNFHRDPHNLDPTKKPIIDGLVQAGVWPDDNSEWVHTNELSLRVVTQQQLPREKVYVRLVPQ